MKPFLKHILMKGVTFIDNTLRCGGSINASGSVGYYEAEIILGEETGIVMIDYDARGIPDRFLIEYDGDIVADSLYVGDNIRGNPPGYSGLLGPHNDLQVYSYNGTQFIPTGATRDVNVVQNDIAPNTPFKRTDGQGTIGFYKSSAIDRMKVISIGPVGGTAWSFSSSCPDGRTNLYLEVRSEFVQNGFQYTRFRVHGTPGTDYTLKFHGQIGNNGYDSVLYREATAAKVIESIDGYTRTTNYNSTVASKGYDEYELTLKANRKIGNDANSVWVNAALFYRDLLDLVLGDFVIDDSNNIGLCKRYRLLPYERSGEINGVTYLDCDGIQRDLRVYWTESSKLFCAIEIIGGEGRYLQDLDQLCEETAPEQSTKELQVVNVVETPREFGPSLLNFDVIGEPNTNYTLYINKGSNSAGNNGFAASVLQDNDQGSLLYLRPIGDTNNSELKVNTYIPIGTGVRSYRIELESNDRQGSSPNNTYLDLSIGYTATPNQKVWDWRLNDKDVDPPSPTGSFAPGSDYSADPWDTVATGTIVVKDGNVVVRIRARSGNKSYMISRVTVNITGKGTYVVETTNGNGQSKYKDVTLAPGTYTYKMTLNGIGNAGGNISSGQGNKGTLSFP